MILMYHNVDEQTGFNTVSADNFERQIRFVKQHWQLTDMDTYVRECRTNPRMATVTFDDAYSCLADSVLPIIRQLEIPITVFVPVSYIGKHNEWDENLFDYKKLNILSWNEIESLSQNSNVTIGSHGMSHTSFGKMSINQSEDELRKSKEILEKHLQKSVDYFAFPFGQNKDFGCATPELLQEIGFKAAFTTLWKRNNMHQNPYRLCRVEIKPTDSIEDFQCYLNRKIDFRFIKQEIKNLIR